jgi:S1-C subfamily serine protease
MRDRLLVPAALIALAGAGAALGIGAAAGWVGARHSRTIVIEKTLAQPAVAPAPAPSLPPRAKPLLGNGFDPAAIYARRSLGVVTIFSSFGGRAAQGSGFVVSADGLVLTDSHVITDAGQTSPGAPVHAADALYLEFADHDRVPAAIVGWDVFDDVGVVRVDPRAHLLSPVPLGDSAAVRVGEPVAAIGSPFGNENSLAVGVVSATHRSIESLTSNYDLVDAIQVDAPINHGNSGGPLFDARGRVIGINAQIRSDTGNAEGVGFAVPIDSAERSLHQLVTKGKVAYAYVGITTEDLTPTLARHLGYRATHGALVDSVLADSPGAKAGLRGGTSQEQFHGVTVSRGGDVILAIEGRPVTSAEDVVRIVAEELEPGAVAHFTIQRGARRLTLPIRLAARPANPHGP